MNRERNKKACTAGKATAQKEAAGFVCAASNVVVERVENFSCQYLLFPEILLNTHTHTLRRLVFVE